MRSQYFLLQKFSWLQTLIQLGVSHPSFDTGARNWVFRWSQLSHLFTEMFFGWVEIWTRVSQMPDRHSVTLPTPRVHVGQMFYSL
jgi:hypothetical protein